MRREELGMAMERSQLVNSIKGLAVQLRVHLLKMMICDPQKTRESWAKEIVAKWMTPARNLILKGKAEKLKVSQYEEFLRYQENFGRDLRIALVHTPILSVDSIRLTWAKNQFLHTNDGLLRYLAERLAAPKLDGDPRAAEIEHESYVELLRRTLYR